MSSSDESNELKPQKLFCSPYISKQSSSDVFTPKLSQVSNYYSKMSQASGSTSRHSDFQACIKDKHIGSNFLTPKIERNYILQKTPSSAPNLFSSDKVKLSSKRSYSQTLDENDNQDNTPKFSRYNERVFRNRRKSFPVDNRIPWNNRKSTADQTPYQVHDSPTHRVKRFKHLLPMYKHWELLSYKSDVGFIDTHCHLDFLFQRQDYEGTYADYQKTHKDTFPASYQGCVAVFCNPHTFEKKSLWEKYLDEDCVWAAFGCHPHNASVFDKKFASHLKVALSHHRVVALGEIGLDYSNRNNCVKKVQHKVLRYQLKMAKKKKLPLVIHCREANEDCIQILKEVIPSDYFIHLHCFTDTWSWAEKWLDSFPNLFIGITNVVTFPSAESVHEVVKNIPLNRLLLETDAPYFIPKGVKQKVQWSHPGLAIHVAAQIAAIRDIHLESVLKSARENTRTMYKI